MAVVSSGSFSLGSGQLGLDRGREEEEEERGLWSFGRLEGRWVVREKVASSTAAES